MNHSNSIHWAQLFSLKSIIFTLLGTLCAAIAIKGFMVPNHFIDGGITGISILLHEIFHVNVAIVLIILNIPFIIIGYFKIGKNFAVQSFIAIILLTFFIWIIKIPVITHEKILIAIFGGFFIGSGIGFVIKAGGVIDGLEVIAEYSNKKFGLTSAEIIMFINTILFLSSAMILGIEKAMFSILTYFMALQVSKYIVDGFEEYTALTVISKESELIKSVIVNDLKKAITVYKGKRGFLPGSFEISDDCDIIMTIVTRLEIHTIKNTIYNLDPNAFVYINRIKEVGGGEIRKLRNH
jgi:uncharacterized membrane-anchored protein YitT (DUF2179 family)